jgi:DNA-directed RNA polymerase subunit K/omega
MAVVNCQQTLIDMQDREIDSVDIALREIAAGNALAITRR